MKIEIRHMEQGLEFDTQLTKTPENVTCAGLSNMDERRAALDRLDELGETAMVFELGGSHIIRAALQSTRVPVIEGLDEAIEFWNKQTGWSFDFSQKHIIMQAARAYAELQKGDLR